MWSSAEWVNTPPPPPPLSLLVRVGLEQKFIFSFFLKFLYCINLYKDLNFISIMDHVTMCVNNFIFLPVEYTSVWVFTPIFHSYIHVSWTPLATGEVMFLLKQRLDMECVPDGH